MFQSITRLHYAKLLCTAVYERDYIIDKFIDDKNNNYFVERLYFLNSTPAWLISSKGIQFATNFRLISHYILSIIFNRKKDVVKANGTDSNLSDIRCGVTFLDLTFSLVNQWNAHKNKHCMKTSTVCRQQYYYAIILNCLSNTRLRTGITW